MKYRFKRKPNRIYTALDFEDKEEIEFAYFPEHPNSKAKGYAFYKNSKGETRLCEQDEIEKVCETNFDRITESVESLAKMIVQMSLSGDFVPCFYAPDGTEFIMDKERAIQYTIEWLKKECE